MDEPTRVDVRLHTVDLGTSGQVVDRLRHLADLVAELRSRGFSVTVGGSLEVEARMELDPDPRDDGDL